MEQSGEGDMEKSDGKIAQNAHGEEIGLGNSAKKSKKKAYGWELDCAAHYIGTTYKIAWQKYRKLL